MFLNKVIQRTWQAYCVEPLCAQAQVLPLSIHPEQPYECQNYITLFTSFYRIVVWKSLNKQYTKNIVELMKVYYKDTF